MVEGCRLPRMVGTMVSLFSSEKTKLGPPEVRIPWAHKAPPLRPQRPHRCVLGPLAGLGPGGTLPLCARRLPAHIKLRRGYTENKVDDGR